jgi:hypothetical protein
VSHGIVIVACTVGAPTSIVAITIANNRLINLPNMFLHLDCWRSLVKTRTCRTISRPFASCADRSFIVMTIRSSNE